MLRSKLISARASWSGGASTRDRSSSGSFATYFSVRAFSRDTCSCCLGISIWRISYADFCNARDSDAMIGYSSEAADMDFRGNLVNCLDSKSFVILRG